MKRNFLKHPPLSRLFAMGLHVGNMERPQALDAHEDLLLATLLGYFLKVQDDTPDSFRHTAVLDFFAYCQLNRHINQAQLLQDLWVLHMTGTKQGGYFVEFGACDGHRLSNTLVLEERHGWTGILAEPNPRWHERLADRNCHISHLCVAAQSGKTAAFLCTENEPELSRLRDIVPADHHETTGNRLRAHEIEIETISLTDLLSQHDAPRYIDYLSIDTEGSELAILEAFDFSRHSFGLITLEHGDEPVKREKLQRLLARHGYENWHPEITKWDDWYVGPEFQAAQDMHPLSTAMTEQKPDISPTPN